MNRIFRGFCINRCGIGPLHYISSRSDFAFEFAEIFEKRLPVSVSRGVDKIAWSIHFFQTFKFYYCYDSTLHPWPIFGQIDSPTQRYAESDSPYRWYAESATLRIIDTESFILKNSIADSPYRWCGESIFEYEYLSEFEAKIGTARKVV
jgi:hypothetical protein